MPKLKFELRSSGYCTSHKNHVLAGAKRETIRFYATWAYIYHPTKGHILFDTGYTKRFYAATKKFPSIIYGKMTPTFIGEKEEAWYQLQEKGVNPKDINYIIISHFHADHVAGLKDFPNAKFVASIEAYHDVKDKTGIAAVRRAFIPELLPEDFESRLQLVNICEGGCNDNHLGQLFDLFDDGSFLLCDLTGHAKGQIGALLETEEGRILLAADAAWVEENYKNMHLPSQIVRLFFDSWVDYKVSLKKVHDFYLANREVVIIPCHCAATIERVGIHEDVSEIG